MRKTFRLFLLPISLIVLTPTPSRGEVGIIVLEPVGSLGEVALGAMFCHHVLSPFEMLHSTRDFISPRVAQLTLEQWQLRRRQDEIRHALGAAESCGTDWSTLAEVNAHIFRRLAAIETEKRFETTRIEGSATAWRELRRGFQALVRPIGRHEYVPDPLKDGFAHYAPDETLSKQLVDYFDLHGRFFVDAHQGGPWISLPLADGTRPSTGLSASEILKGDPRLATLVLAAVIDYNLSQTETHREAIEYVESLLGLFRQATDDLGRLAPSAR